MKPNKKRECGAAARTWSEIESKRRPPAATTGTRVAAACSVVGLAWPSRTSQSTHVGVATETAVTVTPAGEEGYVAVAVEKAQRLLGACETVSRSTHVPPYHPAFPDTL